MCIEIFTYYQSRDSFITKPRNCSQLELATLMSGADKHSCSKLVRVYYCSFSCLLTVCTRMEEHELELLIFALVLQ